MQSTKVRLDKCEGQASPSTTNVYGCRSGVTEGWAHRLLCSHHPSMSKYSEHPSIWPKFLPQMHFVHHVVSLNITVQCKNILALHLPNFELTRPKLLDLTRWLIWIVPHVCFLSCRSDFWFLFNLLVLLQLHLIEVQHHVHRHLFV